MIARVLFLSFFAFHLFFHPAAFVFSEHSIESEEYRAAITEAYDLYKEISDGHLIPYTEDVPPADPALFGIVIVTVKGDVYSIGDSEHPFALQSISKALVYGVALQDYGRDVLVKKVGVEPTGMPFNSIMSVKLRYPEGQNPCVNAGAIATTSLIKGKDSQDKMKRVLKMLEGLTGHRMVLMKRSLLQKENRGQRICR
jgi:glutaminase